MSASGDDTAAGRLRGTGADRRLTHPLLETIPGLSHGFTVRGSEPGAAAAAAAGRPLPLYGARQVHGSEVLMIGDDAPVERPAGEADALITARRGAALGIFVADCAPILLADPVAGLVGAVHAGWRGTVRGVLAGTLAAFSRLGSRSADVVMVIGPHIGRCCFEVGPEVVEEFRRFRPESPGAIVAGAKARIDLEEANRRQALLAGVPRAAIGAVGLCTVCRSDLLESYRRSRGSPGRMAGFIAWSG